MRNVSDKSCRENQNTHFVFSNFIPKIVRLWDNVEKFCTARHATGDNMRFASCITKATDTRMFLHSNKGYANALQYYFICVAYITTVSVV